MRISRTLFLTAALAMPGIRAWSHGDEDHGKQSPAAEASVQAGAPVFLSKESQVLLGVRTAVAASQNLKKRIAALGHVVPRSQGKADVVSPQAGKLILDEHYQLPRIGDRVKKGQIMAEIQVIDTFHVLAPISGVVTEANYTAGEWVEQGKKLFTLLDPSAVWVEANIFEGDITSIEGSQQAFITSPTFPGRQFKGRLVTLGNVLDPETRSAKTVFEVQNPDERLRPGMFVDVAIETTASEESLAVPASAVLDKDGLKVVFVKTGPETFVLRPVEQGGQYGDWVAIKAGLAEGERVVVIGNYQLLTTPPMGNK